MPFVSDAAIVRVQNEITHEKQKNNRLLHKLREGVTVDKTVQLFETVGGGIAAGAARGKFEDANGAFNVPGTPIDIELAAGLVLAAGAFYAGTVSAKAKKLEPHLLNVAGGVLAHYSGQIARNSVKSGSFSMVAGSRGDSLSQLLRGY